MKQFLRDWAVYTCVVAFVLLVISAIAGIGIGFLVGLGALSSDFGWPGKMAAFALLCIVIAFFVTFIERN